MRRIADSLSGNPLNFLTYRTRAGEGIAKLSASEQPAARQRAGAYVGMARWLEDFAYRVEISCGILVFSGLAALGIAWLTVGYHAVKAALTDPVKSLRYE